jgi:hypothetical protein
VRGNEGADDLLHLRAWKVARQRRRLKGRAVAGRVLRRKHLPGCPHTALAVICAASKARMTYPIFAPGRLRGNEGG